MKSAWLRAEAEVLCPEFIREEEKKQNKEDDDGNNNDFGEWKKLKENV